MARRGIKTRAEFLALPSEDFTDALAFEIRRGIQIDELSALLAEKDILTPEAFVALALARL